MVLVVVGRRAGKRETQRLGSLKWRGARRVKAIVSVALKGRMAGYAVVPQRMRITSYLRISGSDHSSPGYPFALHEVRRMEQG